MTSNQSDIFLKRFILFCVFFILANGFVFSQSQDTLSRKDSLRFYKKIKHFAYKHKATSWMYDALFRDPEPKEYPAQPATHEDKNVNPYLKYGHKMIQKINITVYDPFGHSVMDTLPRSTNNL